MIICPDDLIGENDFTVETLGSAEVKHVVCYAEKTFAAELGGKEYYGFNCAIVNILPYNVDRPFCARAFIEYQTDDKTVRFYSAESLSRSVYAVARAARNDLENLDESQKSAVEYFCGAMQTLTPLETISENGGHTFTLTFCGVKGFFVLDYDKSLYEVSGVKLKVGGIERDFSQGITEIAERSDVEVSFSVSSDSPFFGCPVKGKVYVTD